MGDFNFKPSGRSCFRILNEGFTIITDITANTHNKKKVLDYIFIKNLKNNEIKSIYFPPVFTNLSDHSIVCVNILTI